MTTQFNRLIQVNIHNITIQEPRIEATIQLSGNKEQDTAEINIYNLKKQTHENIENKGTEITIAAGYKQGIGIATIFTGYTQHINKIKETTDHITNITLSDSLRSPQTQGAHIEHTCEGLVSAREIAKAITKDMNLTPGPLDAIPENLEINNFICSGKPIDSMNALEALIPNASYMITSDNKVRWSTKKQPQPDIQRIILSQYTGLIGIPQVTENNQLQATTLFDHRIKPGGEIIIKDSKYVKEIPYTITYTTHEISNWTGPFTTTIECTPPEE